MCIPKLDFRSLQIYAYSDFAFANNADSSSQLGYIILLTYATNKAVGVSYKSYKVKRIARSVLSAEVIAFADFSDNAIAIRKQLEFILKPPIPVMC